MNRMRVSSSSVHPIRMGAIFILLLVLQMLFTTKTASAHVALIRSEPADGAALSDAPSELQLWFSEAISMQFSSIQLLDEQDQPLADTEVLVDPAQPDTLRMKLPALAKGNYTLFWKAFSETDGHLTQGFVVFRIGAGQARTHASQLSTSAAPALLETALHWANLFFLASVVGALALFAFVLTPRKAQSTAAAGVAQSNLRRKLLQWASLCAGGAFLASIGLLAWQVHLTQPATAETASWLARARPVLIQTHWGWLWLARALLLVWLGGGLMLLARRSSISNWLLLAVGGRALDLVVVQALSGHAVSGEANWLVAAASVAAHLLAASLWIGGLAALVVVVFPAMRRGVADGSTWRAIDWGKFSLLAALSVGLLFASGLYTMGLQVASLDALLTTFYGKVLLGKLGFVLLAGACGLVNAMLVHPKLATPLARLFGRPPGWTPLAIERLPGLIGVELFFGACIFAATGVLSASAPPRGAEYIVAAENVQPWLAQRVDDVLLTLEVRPNRPGPNVINVRAVNTSYPTAIQRYNVSLRLAYRGPHATGAKSEKIVAPSLDGTNDVYQLTNEDLAQAGPWQIDVTIQRNSGETSVASFNWIMPPPGELQPTVFSKAPLATTLTLLAVVVLSILLLSAGALWRLRTRKPVSPRPATHDPNGYHQPVSLPG